MSEDGADEDLLELLRESLGVGSNDTARPPSIQVLEDAEFVFDNATDVALDMRGTKAAASKIYSLVQEKDYGMQVWGSHELHPKSRDQDTVNFIFLMDLLNFSFWSANDDKGKRFAIEYRGKTWSGYWSLVAALQRALEEGIPITCPHFWVDEVDCSDEVLKRVFRSSTTEQIPLLEERIHCIREAGHILHKCFEGRILRLLEEANGSAAALVNLLITHFPCFNDTHRFEDRRIRFYKRAQIMVADLWACFEGEGHGSFSDIEQVTIFADYRIPQILHTLGCISYSPLLESCIRQLKVIESGHPWEVQIRGCSIWCVELIRREIVREHPESRVNAVLIDYFLYDTVTEMEHKDTKMIPHHRTRSIWY